MQEFPCFQTQLFNGIKASFRRLLSPERPILPHLVFIVGND